MIDFTLDTTATSPKLLWKHKNLSDGVCLRPAEVDSSIPTTMNQSLHTRPVDTSLVQFATFSGMKVGHAASSETVCASKRRKTSSRDAIERTTKPCPGCRSRIERWIGRWTVDAHIEPKNHEKHLFIGKSVNLRHDISAEVTVSPCCFS